MSKETKHHVVPKLRFPEFEVAKEWTEATLGKVTYPVSEKNKEGKKYPIYSINNVEGFLPQSSQFEGVNSHDRGYDISLYKIIRKNTFAYNPARINIGSLGYSGELNDIIISSLYVCFKTGKDIDDLFLLYFLKSEGFNESVKKSVEGGIRSYLFYENLAKIRIQFPAILEQQKIADCLSSLDELITTQCQKLEVLKTHKKGLMQQLFPTEGEAVPKLRFDKFKDDGEWDVKLIGEIAKVTTGNKDTQNKVKNGLYPFFVRSQTVERIDSYSYDGEAILTSGDGVGVGRNFHYIEGKFDFHQRVYCIYKFEKYIYGHFLYLYFSEHFVQRVMKLSAKNSVDSVRMAMITEMPVFLPSLEEQKRIADCLSSLDKLITAQTEKVEAFKIHKKGLMQQLFPANDSIQTS